MNTIKMASLLAVYLVALSFHSQAQSTISLGTTVVAGAPFLSTYAAVNCLGSGHENYSCLEVMVLGPLSTSEILTTIALLKEDIRNVEVDAYDYMAGEPMTLALQALLKEFREHHPELKDAEDKDLIKFIIQNA